MSFQYKQTDIILSYKSEYLIDIPEINIINKDDIEFSFKSEVNESIILNKQDGSILLKSSLEVGQYRLHISLNNILETEILVTIKPVVYYKVFSFYYNEINTIITPKISPIELDYNFSLETNEEGVIINNKTGIISFDETVKSKNYKLVVITNVNGLELKSALSFNIYPAIDYLIENNTIYIDHWDKYNSPIPKVNPSGGEFIILNEPIGIEIDSKTGVFTLNEPKAGFQNLIITYRINNLSLSLNINLYIKTIVTYNKFLIEYNKTLSSEMPFTSEYGGIFEINSEFKFFKYLSINQKNGKITVSEGIPSGEYKINIEYSINNYKNEYLFELTVYPQFYYENATKEIIYGKKDLSEEPFLSEIPDGIFTILNPIPNVYINPKNGIIYFDLIIDVGEYYFEINYNKNGLNKSNNFKLIVKPYIDVLDPIQIIYQNEKLNDILINVLPENGIFSNNLKIPFKNNKLLLSEFDNKIDNWTIEIIYEYNKIKNIINYNFEIKPIFNYTLNKKKIFFGSKFISEIPNINPINGKFSIIESNLAEIDVNTGVIIINKQLAVSQYELNLVYEYNNIKSSTNYFIEIYPYIQYAVNSYDIIHNPNGDIIKTPSPKFSPIGGKFECDQFTINDEGNILVPSNLDINKYIVNVNYTYNLIKTKLNYLINVLPCKLDIKFNLAEKIYDGLLETKVRHNLSYKLLYDGIFIDSNVGKNKKVFITNIKVDSDKTNNFIFEDYVIKGTIHPKLLDITFYADDKIYDGTKHITVKWKLNNIINNDDVNIKSVIANLKNVNVGKQTVIITNIILEGESKKNYVCDELYEIEAIIKPKELSIIFESIPKVFNNNLNASLKLMEVKGLCFNNIVMLDSYNAEYDDINVGINKLININKIRLKGKDALNYIPISIEKVYGSIYPLEINYTATVENKIYDSTDKAIINFVPNPNYEIISYEAKYNDKNIGTNKIVKLTNIKINNPNYILNNSLLKGNISPKNIILNITCKDKIYNENQNVESTYELCDIYNYDIIDVEYTSLLKNINVGENKEIYITNIKLLGKDRINYKIGKINVNKINISKKKLHIDFIGIDKIYDSTNKAIVNVKTIYLDKTNKDKIKVIGFNSEYIDKNVGYNKKILINNIKLDNNNYYVDDIIIYGNILPKQINVSVNSISKKYDGLLDANINIIGIKGVCFNDNVYITNYNAKYQDYNVGNNKTIIIDNINIEGIDSNNYEVIQPIKTIGIIEKKDINIEFVNNNLIKTNNILPQDNIKIKLINKDRVLLDGQQAYNYRITNYKYVNQSNIDINFICSDKVYDGDIKVNAKPNYNLNIKYEAYMDDADVGINKKVYIKVIDTNEEYESTVNVLPKEINITIQPIIKEYDNLNDTIVYFDTSFNILSYWAYFQDKTIGTNKTVYIKNIIISNTNYKVNDIITKGTITPKYLQPILYIQNKQYDGTTKAIIEKIIIDEYLDVKLLSYIGEFDSINLGEHNVLIKSIKLSNPNYLVKDILTKGIIIPKKVKIKCQIKTKEYDGTNKGEFLTYKVEKDTIPTNILVESCNINFEDININDKIKVYITNIKLNNNNYECDEFISWGTIKPRELKIIFNNINKIYDKNRNTNLTIKSINGIINNDKIWIENYKSEYEDSITYKNKIFISEIKLGGVNIENYYINNHYIEAFINPIKLEYIIKTHNKIFNGNNDANVSITLTNVLKGDYVFIESYISVFDDEKVGDNKKVIIYNIKLGGLNKNNYYIDNEIYANANIF
jgi:hypothetical protein